MYAAGDPFRPLLEPLGGSYACADDDASRNFSSIACEAADGVANVGGFSGSDEQWQIRQGVRRDSVRTFRSPSHRIEP